MVLKRAGKNDMFNVFNIFSNMRLTVNIKSFMERQTLSSLFLVPEMKPQL